MTIDFPETLDRGTELDITVRKGTEWRVNENDQLVSKLTGLVDIAASTSIIASVEAPIQDAVMGDASLETVSAEGATTVSGSSLPSFPGPLIFGPPSSLLRDDSEDSFIPWTIPLE
ncbi:hypothetical protein MPER_01901 [Moniliophthora perniciosa FA553]|nr:hypothetical protein MPER_01901 [Moniliophthora perniciosa FA553]